MVIYCREEIDFVRSATQLLLITIVLNGVCILTSEIITTNIDNLNTERTLKSWYALFC